jgi:AraC family transcriptional regulator, transcriptional activator of pobA
MKHLDDITPTFDKLRDRFAKNTDVYFQTASYTKEQIDLTGIPFAQRHTHFEIIWLKNCKGVHHVDFVSYPIEGSVIFMLAPDQVHQLSREFSEEEHYVLFKQELFLSQDLESFLYELSLFGNIDPEPIIPIPEAYAEELQILFDQMKKEEELKSLSSREVITAYLRILLLKLSRLKKSGHNQNIQMMDERLKLYSSFMKLINAHYKESHEVQQYAEMLNVQPRKLNEQVKHYACITAQELIKRRIMLEAKRLLFQGQKNVKEIAYALGYDDPAYFNRFFKRNTNLSPLQFREHELERTK